MDTVSNRDDELRLQEIDPKGLAALVKLFGDV